MKIERALLDLGLTENEVLVYISLLKLGKGTAYQISEACGLRPSTVYGLLDTLRARSVVLKAPHAKKQIYIPKNPTELLDGIKQKVTNAESLLPELLAMTPKTGKIGVLYFDGLKGIEEALIHRQNEMTGKDIVGFYAHSPDDPGEFANIWGRWVKRMVKEDIHNRGIMPYHKQTVAYAKQQIKKRKITNLEMRSLPIEQYSSLVSIEISDHIILMISRHKDQTVIIENEDIANTLKQLFELQWAVAKPL